MYHDYFFEVSGVWFQRCRGFEKLVNGTEYCEISNEHRRGHPAISGKKLCSYVSVVFGMWQRFVTAITRVIVAAPLEKQRDASTSHSHQPLIRHKRH